MPLKSETHEFQSKLAQFCRTNTLEEIPGVRPKRVGTYRRLVFNAVCSALENCYPITKKILGEERWLELVNDFFQNHDATSFQLWHFPKELLDYSRSNKLVERYDMPFLDDLLMFEWVEIEIYMMRDVELPEHTFEGSPLESELVLNPHFKIIPLNYPVFTTTDEEALRVAGRFFLLVYRTIDNNKVRFSNLSPLAVCVLQLLADEPLSGRDALEASAEHLGVEINDSFLLEGSALIEELLKDSVVLGYIA